MDLLLLLSLLLSAVLLIFFWVKRRSRYFKDLGIPYIEPEFYYGNARGAGTKFHFSALLLKIYLKLKSQGPVAGIHVYRKHAFLLTDPEMVKHVFVKDFNNFPNRGHYFNEKDDPLSANLMHIEDEHWRRLHKKISPMFTSGKLKSMFGLFSEITDRLVATILKEADDSIELRQLFVRFTVDVFAFAAFGIESNTLKDKTNKFLEMSLRVMGPQKYFKAFLTSNRRLGNLLGIRLSGKETRGFFLDIVERTIEYRKQNPEIKRNDFMDQLIKLMDPSHPDHLNLNEVAAQSFISFIAGYDTSASALTFCTYELSQNQKIQSKLRESIKQTLEKFSGEVTYESVAQMHYLEQCINESLRKYPPSFHLTRQSKEEFKVPNTDLIIPRDSWIMIPTYAFHRDPDIYPDPEKYDPDRFSPEEVQKRHPFTFLPFGEGPHICIAMRLALMELKIALAKLVLNFKFELDHTRTSVPLKIAPNRRIILTPAEGVYVKFQKI